MKCLVLAGDSSHGEAFCPLARTVSRIPAFSAERAGISAPGARFVRGSTAMRWSWAAFVVSTLAIAGCGQSTTTVIEATTTTLTETETRSVTTPAPLPAPDPTKTVACLNGVCQQGQVVVDFNPGDGCGLNGSWQDAGADAKTGAGLYKCVEGPAP